MIQRDSQDFTLRTRQDIFPARNDKDLDQILLNIRCATGDYGMVRDQCSRSWALRICFGYVRIQTSSCKSFKEQSFEKTHQEHRFGTIYVFLWTYMNTPIPQIPYASSVISYRYKLEDPSFNFSTTRIGFKCTHWVIIVVPAIYRRSQIRMTHLDFFQNFKFQVKLT